MAAQETTSTAQTQHADPIVVVAPEGRIKRVGFKIACPGCGWESHRYDQRSTAELIFGSHAVRCSELRSGKI